MALVLTKVGRAELARSLRRDIVNENDYYYFSIGRTLPWSDEEIPPNPVDSERAVNDFRRQIMFVQKVTSADTVNLCRRINWESGTVYDQYDDRYGELDSDGNVIQAYSGVTTLADSNFYVMTDSYRVYKCIYNNNNSPSTSFPQTTDDEVEVTADGYQWKFMFSVSAADQTKFLDSSWIPVRKLTGNPTFDVNGEIDSISVTAGGSGYTSAPGVIINGDGTGASATAVMSGDAVDSITINNSGTGYSFAFVTFSGGGGTDAQATVSLGSPDSAPSDQSNVEASAIPGGIDRIEVTSGGQDYIEGDVVVKITGDGTGAAASAVIAEGTGSITGIVLTSVGSGYTYADISFTQLGIGTGATARATIAPLTGHGSNPVKELFASNLGLVISLSDVTNPDLILNNDFRQIGLLKNAGVYNNVSVPFSTTTGTASFVANVDAGQELYYAEDDVITTDGGGQFVVAQIVEQTDGTFNIYLRADVGIISSSSILTNETQDPSGSLTINSVSNPEVDVTTGDIIYMENRTSINRQEDQVETIKAIIRF